MHQQSIGPIISSLSQTRPTARTDIAMLSEMIDIGVYDRIESIREEWLEAEKRSQISVYQRYEWVESYLRSQQSNKQIQPFIIVGRFEGKTVFILPCEIHGGLFRRLKFIGGSHVNFNLGILPDNGGLRMTSADFQKVFARISNLVPGLGYLAFCCQPEFWQGEPNPIVGPNHQRSANPAFLLDLQGGFEATLARGNAKRKRKKFRSQCRATEEMGGYELHQPATAHEIRRVVDVFLEQKSRRLKELGIRDVFAGSHMRDYLIGLATRSMDMDEPLLTLYSLRIGGEIAAVFGGGVQSKRLSGFFSSIDEENFGSISPGEMLLYLVVEDACSRGYVQMDLGAGDERYKRSWSTEVVDMYDLFVPINAMCIPVAAARKFYGLMRRRVREDERYWELYKKARRIKSSLLGISNQA